LPATGGRFCTTSVPCPAASVAGADASDGRLSNPLLSTKANLYVYVPTGNAPPPCGDEVTISTDGRCVSKIALPELPWIFRFSEITWTISVSSNRPGTVSDRNAVPGRRLDPHEQTVDRVRLQHVAGDLRPDAVVVRGEQLIQLEPGRMEIGFLEAVRIGRHRRIRAERDPVEGDRRPHSMIWIGLTT
jgi:hypothetical protein